MKKIAVYGAGGFGREVACLIEQINAKEPQWQFVGFYDDGHQRGDRIDMGEVLGGIGELNAVSEPLAVALAFGSPQTLKAVHEKINNPLISFPNLIDPMTDFLNRESLRMGVGNIICNKAVFSLNVQMGDFNVWNGDTGVGHDTVVGSYNVFMPGVKVSGAVNVGDCNLFGMMSGILQGVRVGSNVRVGTGSMVMRNTKDNRLYFGNPAKAIDF